MSFFFLPTLSSATYVTLGHSKLSSPQFAHLQNGIDNGCHLTEQLQTKS